MMSKAEEKKKLLTREVFDWLLFHELNGIFGVKEELAIGFGLPGGHACQQNIGSCEMEQKLI